MFYINLIIVIAIVCAVILDEFIYRIDAHQTMHPHIHMFSQAVLNHSIRYKLALCGFIPISRMFCGISMVDNEGCISSSHGPLTPSTMRHFQDSATPSVSRAPRASWCSRNSKQHPETAREYNVSQLSIDNLLMTVHRNDLVNFASHSPRRSILDLRARTSSRILLLGWIYRMHNLL